MSVCVCVFAPVAVFPVIAVTISVDVMLRYVGTFCRTWRKWKLAHDNVVECIQAYKQIDAHTGEMRNCLIANVFS